MLRQLCTILAIVHIEAYCLHQQWVGCSKVGLQYERFLGCGLLQLLYSGLGRICGFFWVCPSLGGLCFLFLFYQLYPSLFLLGLRISSCCLVFPATFFCCSILCQFRRRLLSVSRRTAGTTDFRAPRTNRPSHCTLLSEQAVGKYDICARLSEQGYCGGSRNQDSKRACFCCCCSCFCRL